MSNWLELANAIRGVTWHEQGQKHVLGYIPTLDVEISVSIASRWSSDASDVVIKLFDPSTGITISSSISEYALNLSIRDMLLNDLVSSLLSSMVHKLFVGVYNDGKITTAPLRPLPPDETLKHF